MEARTGSVVDLFEAVVALMIAPVEEDRAVVDLSAAAWARKVRCCRHGGYARTSPVVITLRAVGTKTCAVGSYAIAISILALAELDVKDPDAANEVEGITRDVDISALVRLDLDQGQGSLRHADLRRIPEGNVVQPFHWRLHGRGAERRPHRAAPDLQGRLDRPGRDPADEDRPCMGTRRRCGPAACQTEQDGAVHLIGLRRLDRPDEARYCDGYGSRRGSDPVLHDADSHYNGSAIQNNTNDSKDISSHELRCDPQRAGRRCRSDA